MFIATGDIIAIDKIVYHISDMAITGQAEAGDRRRRNHQRRQRSRGRQEAHIIREDLYSRRVMSRSKAAGRIPTYFHIIPTIHTD